MSFFCTMVFDKPVPFEDALKAIELTPEWCRTTGMPGRDSYLDVYRNDPPTPELHMGGSWTYAGKRLEEYMDQLSVAMSTIGYTCIGIHYPYDGADERTTPFADESELELHL